MPYLRVKTEADGGAWPDLADKRDRVIEVDAAEVCGLSRGMESGKPSVAMRLDLPDGRTVIFQTSLQLFLTAADVLKAYHGDPRD